MTHLTGVTPFSYPNNFEEIDDIAKGVRSTGHMFRSKFFISTFYSEHFGVKHHKYSDALLDYGFFLLNVDAIAQSVEVRISLWNAGNFCHGE